MGVTGRVTSPTFVIARVHRPAADDGRTVPLVHVDAYRLAGAVELDDLDLDTDLDAAAVVIEWGEGVAERLSDERLIIELVRLPDDTRTARLTPVGASWPARVPGDPDRDWPTAAESLRFGVGHPGSLVHSGAARPTVMV